jgi:hypothetical protein
MLLSPPQLNAGTINTTGVRKFFGMYMRNAEERKDWMGVGLKEGG